MKLPNIIIENISDIMFCINHRGCLGCPEYEIMNCKGNMLDNTEGYNLSCGAGNLYFEDKTYTYKQLKLYQIKQKLNDQTTN